MTYTKNGRATRKDGKGYWIAFEGTDGCGKSTQAGKLAQKLDAFLTWEPGNTVIGDMIRYILLNQKESMTFKCEALLFAADRAEHISSVVRPRLDKGINVVSDRSIWSSVVYQGIGRGLEVDKILEIGSWASEGVLPDIVVYLRNDTKKALDKISTPDRIESEGYEFMNRAEEGFYAMAKKYNWIMVDTGTVAEVEQQIEQAINARIKELNA